MEGIKAPSADYNAGNGNLLENPQDIARHLIEAVNGDKDQTIAELNKICMQSHSVLFVDFNNEWKMVSLSAGTSAMTITSGDIRSDANGRPTTGINAVTLTPLSELYNEFTINYNWDNGQERFLNELYIRDDGTSTVTTPSFVSSPASLGGYATLCGTSYQNYNGYKNRLIIDADWINDDATAELLLIELVTFFKDRKHVVNIETKNDFTVGASDYSLELELGDQVLINWADYLPTGVTNSALFMLFKNDFITYQNNNCYQKLSFLEIPAALEVGAYSNGYSDGYENQGS